MIPMLLTLTLALTVVNMLLIFRVYLPLRGLAQQAQSITEGDFNAIKQSSQGVREIETIRCAMEAMLGHVRRAQEQSKTYAEALMNGQEAERARIARDLHDDTVQSLIAIAQSIDIASQWTQSKPELATEMFGTARTQSLEAIQRLRDLIGDLRPPALAELGLIAALRLQNDRFDGATVQVEVVGEQRRLPSLHELALFRAAQEAMTNARRHGNATEINVRVKFAPEWVVMEIADNGSGITSPPNPLSAPRVDTSVHGEGEQSIPNLLDRLIADGHYGLRGIRERVASLGGTAALHRSASGGVTVTLTVPTGNGPQPESTVRDPVCLAEIEPQGAFGSVEYEGETYYFCCPVCQGAFQKSPESYVVDKPI